MIKTGSKIGRRLTKSTLNVHAYLKLLKCVSQGNKAYLVLTPTHVEGRHSSSHSRNDVTSNSVTWPEVLQSEPQLCPNLLIFLQYRIDHSSKSIVSLSFLCSSCSPSLPSYLPRYLLEIKKRLWDSPYHPSCWSQPQGLDGAKVLSRFSIIKP